MNRLWEVKNCIVFIYLTNCCFTPYRTIFHFHDSILFGENRALLGLSQDHPQVYKAFSVLSVEVARMSWT